MSDGDLDALAARAGIERVYHDQFGTRHEASAEVVRAMIAALGFDGAEAAASPVAAAPQAPGRAYMPAALEHGPGTWGFAIQLYSLRSPRDWGIGDFSMLKRFVALAAAAGAGVVGLNPLHALYPDEPDRASPYSPSSRRFLNPLYIDVEGTPDWAECDEARWRAATPDFRATLTRLRAAEMVDYRAVAECKLGALALLHDSFQRRHVAAASGRARAFRAFCEAEGQALHRFAVYQALREARGRADVAQRSWLDWPAALRDPASPAVAAFARDNAARIAFFEYLQWLAHEQLAACAAAAAAMPVGLYRDLAVSVAPDSGEAWAEPEVIVPGFSLGAPPDDWNRKGQDWGLAPLNPAALKRAGYRPFADLLHANMRAAGALRIDHILGLWRCFWIRHGDAPRAGAYLRYPFGKLLATLIEESRRARCVAIGEDLGTVPPGLREALGDAGVLSYRLFYFERRHDGAPRPPHEYPRQALVSVGTHDLPPLAGYWRGGDLAARAALGFFPAAGQLEAEYRQRAADCARLADALRGQGLIGAETPAEAPIEAAYRFLARTPARLVMVQIEDALGLTEPVNVPGTPDAAPNWRRRLPFDVDAIFASPRVQALCAALARERPRAP